MRSCAEDVTTVLWTVYSSGYPSTSPDHCSLPLKQPLMAEDTGKQKGVDSLAREKHLWSECLIMIMSFAFLVSWSGVVVVRRKRSGTPLWQCLSLPLSNRQKPHTMIQLPSNFSLPLWPVLLQSSGRNVAQIRVSARWGGWETGKQREGKKKRKRERERGD